jgi:hypothetical protein
MIRKNGRVLRKVLACVLKYDFRMGDELSTIIRNFSFAPRLGSGFLTDGKLLKFKSAYPHGSTQFTGAEVSLDFNGHTPDEKTERRIGEWAVMYYYGRSDDHFDQSDLPLGDNPLLNLIRFETGRQATSHVLLSEWRWPLFAPAYQSAHVRLIQPQYSLGLGAMYIHTKIEQDNSPTEEASAFAGFVTGSTQLRLMEVSLGRWDLSFEASVRMLAGQAYGLIGEGAIRLTYNR